MKHTVFVYKFYWSIYFFEQYMSLWLYDMIEKKNMKGALDRCTSWKPTELILSTFLSHRSIMEMHNWFLGIMKTLNPNFAVSGIHDYFLWRLLRFLSMAIVLFLLGNAT